MQSCRTLSLVWFVFAAAAVRTFAEVPPRSNDELDAAATLIVTGIVTEVHVGRAKGREDGTEYVYDLTVQVQKVKKGKFELGTTLVARGSYIQLKSGVAGGSGHYSGNSNDRLNTIGAGSELTLHLSESNDGARGIVGPNGFAVLMKVPPPDPWWPWMVGGAVLGLLLLIGVFARRRQRN